MQRIHSVALATLVLSCATAGIPAIALAQEKQHVSFKADSQNSKVTGQNTDVGDVPGHIVRMFEVHRTYPSNPPVINGLKLVEEWDRGLADLTDGNGSANEYDVWVMENGDKLFARGVNVVEAASGKLRATGVRTITGGTGKLAAIRGTAHTMTSFDIKSGFNEGQIDIDYTIGK